MERLEMALSEVEATGTSRALLFTGPSGSGKTHLMQALEKRMPRSQKGIQREIPFCCVTLGISSDPSSIMRRILRELGKPESMTSSTKAKDLEWQVFDAMDAARVKVLAIEEFHNALLKTSKDLRGKSKNLIKNLWNAEGRTKRVYLISGTEEILGTFNEDKELDSRFCTRIEAVSLWFDSPDGIRHFPAVAASIANRHRVQELIDLQDPLVLARLLFACRGHLRYLDTLLSRVATITRRDPTVLDGVRALDFAYEVTLARNAQSNNPFRWTDDEVRIRIGTETQGKRL